MASLQACKDLFNIAVNQISQSVSAPISDSLYAKGNATSYARLRTVFGIKSLIILCSLPMLALLYKLRIQKSRNMFIGPQLTACIGYGTMAYNYIQRGWMESERERPLNESADEANSD